MIRLALLFLVACTTIEAPTPDFAHSVTWSATGMSDSPGEPNPIACTAVVSHPCPLLLYMRRVVLMPVFDGDGTESIEVTWEDASGGADVNGRDVETIAPIVEIVTVAHSALQLADRGDDGGLRHAAALTRDNSGVYSGDVAWSLFNVAGHTTWHVTIGDAP